MIRLPFPDKNQSGRHAEVEKRSLDTIKRRMLSPFRWRHDHVALVEKQCRNEDEKETKSKVNSATFLTTKEDVPNACAKEKLAPTHRVRPPNQVICKQISPTGSGISRLTKSIGTLLLHNDVIADKMEHVSPAKTLPYAALESPVLRPRSLRRIGKAEQIENNKAEQFHFERPRRFSTSSLSSLTNSPSLATEALPIILPISHRRGRLSDVLPVDHEEIVKHQNNQCVDSDHTLVHRQVIKNSDKKKQTKAKNARVLRSPRNNSENPQLDTTGNPVSPVRFRKRSKAGNKNAYVSHQSISFAGDAILDPIAGDAILDPNGKNRRNVSAQIPRRLRSMSPVKSLQSSSGVSMSRLKPPYTPLLQGIETHRTVGKMAFIKSNIEHWTRIACFSRRRVL